jgi:hypothetical protein
MATPKHRRTTNIGSSMPLSTPSNTQIYHLNQDVTSSFCLQYQEISWETDRYRVNMAKIVDNPENQP